jgi:hypothetical protein
VPTGTSPNDLVAATATVDVPERMLAEERRHVARRVPRIADGESPRAAGAATPSSSAASVASAAPGP